MILFKIAGGTARISWICASTGTLSSLAACVAHHIQGCLPIVHDCERVHERRIIMGVLFSAARDPKW
ncbi:hypothetical protein WAI453_011572 [Rhynchosporium graminicola]